MMIEEERWYIYCSPSADKVLVVIAYATSTAICTA